MERYLSFPFYCKKTYGYKIFRIPLNANMTCPNRDGLLDTRGCIFCNGSGDFSSIYQGEKIHLEDYPYVHQKDKNAKYIGYFQAYTNTYAPIEVLRKLYTSALEDSLLCGISIATRPDCLQEDVLVLLKELKEKYPNKLIWVELGLQSIHEKSALWMRRGYPLEVFDEAVKNLQNLGIDVIVHIILGLPMETKEDVLQTIHHLNGLHINGIKLQLLHVLKETDLEKEYLEGKMQLLSKEAYIDLICDCIGHLDKNIVIHRLTGDGKQSELIAPQWSLEKRKILNEIQKKLKERNIIQGCYIMD